jgi:hypothetical protein
MPFGRKKDAQNDSNYPATPIGDLRHMKELIALLSETNRSALCDDIKAYIGGI